MSKALELAIFAAMFLGITSLASHLHYAAGYSVNDWTIWAVACVVGVVGFVGCVMAAIFAFGTNR